MKPKGTRRILVVGDTQVGSSVALWPDGYANENGSKLPCSPAQSFLLSCWQAMVKEVSVYRPTAVVFMGDAIQGTNRRDGQLMTTDLAVQQGAFSELWQPIAKLVPEQYFIIGTGFHDGNAGEHIENVARAAGAIPDATTEKHARWELYLDLSTPAVPGPILNFAHHIGVSGVPTMEAGAPYRDMLNNLGEMLRVWGATAPQVKCWVRAHRHRFVHVETYPDLHAVVFPGWQLRTEYTFKKAGVMLPQIGYGYLEWDGRDLLVRGRNFQLPLPLVEALGADRR